MNTKIAIQGIKGAFHEEVALHCFGNDIEIVPCITFKELIDNVVARHVEKAVMAIENTISGTMHENLELIRMNGLEIIGELPWKIHQNLCVVPGTSIDMLTEIHSHHMALKQCRSYFDNYPEIKLVETEDTALSIKNVAENANMSIGALGSKHAAQLYGLEI
ncbi:prephenate dehydratase, partial [Arenibacter sp. BSSL-BM3]